MLFVSLACPTFSDVSTHAQRSEELLLPLHQIIDLFQHPFTELQKAHSDAHASLSLEHRDLYPWSCRFWWDTADEAWQATPYSLAEATDVITSDPSPSLITPLPPPLNLLLLTLLCSTKTAFKYVCQHDNWWQPQEKGVAGPGHRQPNVKFGVCTCRWLCSEANKRTLGRP